jgi:hypothetical protein
VQITLHGEHLSEPPQAEGEVTSIAVELRRYAHHSCMTTFRRRCHEGRRSHTGRI